MTMKEVADELDIHESTVSRAVKGKYVQTPFGTIEMRIFFSTSLSSMDYEQDISGIQAKKFLAAAIKNENKQKPLSDQELVDLLKRENGLVLATSYSCESTENNWVFPLHRNEKDMIKNKLATKFP